MKLSALDWVLWVSCFIGNIALFSTLIYRRRCKGFPIFTMFIGFGIALTVALFSIYANDSRLWYARVYYTGDIFEFALQLGVIWEVARIVMRPTGSWLRDARKQFILVGTTGILLAAALAWMLSPRASTLLVRLERRSDLFTDLVFCELFILMLLTAKNLGLGYRNHVFALVNGWSGWVIVAILVDLAQSYLGTPPFLHAFDNMKGFAYLAALVYWIIQFWADEPPRQPLPPEFEAYLLALHERIKKDVDTMGVQR